MNGQFTSLFGFIVCVCIFTRSTVALKTLFEGDACETAEKGNGICKLLTDCNEIYVNVVKDKDNVPAHKRCSFVRQEEVVCCPSLSIGDRSDIKRLSEAACDRYKMKSSNHYYIINGTDARSDEFPHMVALGTKDTTGKTSYKCGGSLISELYVLTAAHCATNPGFPVDHVRLGVTKLDDVDNASDIDVEQIIVHPDYKPTRGYNDIALLKLGTWVGNKKPVCLSTEVPPFPPATVLVASGWGVTDIKTRESANDLQKVTLQYVDRNRCNEMYKNIDRFNTTNPLGLLTSQFCAAEEGKDTCWGDSGGPLHAISEQGNGSVALSGIVSFGNFCGSDPGVYTSVLFYLDWIESIVWKDK